MHMTLAARRTLAHLRTLIAEMDRKEALDRATRGLEEELRHLCALDEDPAIRRRWPAALRAQAKRASRTRARRLWSKVARLQCAAA